MNKKLLFITSNLGKVEEARKFLSKLNVEIAQLNLKYPEIQSNSLMEIARYGAEYCYSKLKKPLFVEDSGLFIKALNGFPGPYSSYVFKTIGNIGLLRLMQGVEKREAYFKSVVAYHDGENIKIFSGIVRGKISYEAKGSSGFGFDPIFLYGAKTFAELTVEEKNKVSHRSKSLSKLARWLIAKS
ncbi:MAG: XTP/dITP diphosphatase [Halobacteria archaeon]